MLLEPVEPWTVRKFQLQRSRVCITEAEFMCHFKWGSASVITLLPIICKIHSPSASKFVLCFTELFIYLFYFIVRSSCLSIKVDWLIDWLIDWSLITMPQPELSTWGVTGWWRGSGGKLAFSFNLMSEKRRWTSEVKIAYPGNALRYFRSNTASRYYFSSHYNVAWPDFALSSGIGRTGSRGRS